MAVTVKKQPTAVVGLRIPVEVKAIYDQLPPQAKELIRMAIVSMIIGLKERADEVSMLDLGTVVRFELSLKDKSDCKEVIERWLQKVREFKRQGLRYDPEFVLQKILEELP